MLVDADGNAVMLECKDGVPCEWTLSAKNLFTCHQRMREAMKGVDRQLEDPPGVYYARPRFFWLSEAQMPTWHQTMKDCVEGSK